ncbi:putative acetyltransferase [Crossiella equi]|uniref:Acetyltransferase n=1 Tax=Crossiella equi TaxID=130796 RepID=A0ABS5AE99_9PSEU|nr:GNAT family N-acetyltransferase [Crossiella equi]MBP2474907.1 putative acetyltransferase [Crossiella equi]
MGDVTIREYQTGDAETAWRLRQVPFGGPVEVHETWLRQPVWRGFLASTGGADAGFAMVRPYRQFFGGRAVPMGGVASVAVAPEARGKGVGGALMEALIADMRQQGQPISALYPTVPALYRSRGWERGGVLESVELPVHAFQGRRARIDLRGATEADLPAMREQYHRLARGVDGMLDRRTASHRPQELLACAASLVTDGGYLLAEPDRQNRVLEVRELVADTPEVALGLLDSIGSWTGLLDRVKLHIADETLLGVLEWSALDGRKRTQPWLLRVVDLPAAVAARGWPTAPHLHGQSVDLEIEDTHAPWHAGRQRLVVEDGAVRVEPGGTGAVRLTARGLGAWYSGSASTAGLRRAGLLEGDPGHTTLLDLLVGAPGTPRMADYF